MNCEKIRTILITDYLDARLQAQDKSFIDNHLEHCPECSSFLAAIKKEVVSPLTHIAQVSVDDKLWAGIKQVINEEKQQQLQKNLEPSFWESLIAGFQGPRPAVALASILTVILMVGTTGQFFINQAVPIKAQAQVEYLNSLVTDPVGVDTENGLDLQTPIEKYFL